MDKRQRGTDHHASAHLLRSKYLASQSGRGQPDYVYNPIKFQGHTRGKVARWCKVHGRKCMTPYTTPAETNMLIDIFAALDTNRNGALDIKEMLDAVQIIIGRNIDPHVVNEFIKQVDKSGDGTLSLHEFTTYLGTRYLGRPADTDNAEIHLLDEALIRLIEPELRRYVAKSLNNMYDDERRTNKAMTMMNPRQKADTLLKGERHAQREKATAITLAMDRPYPNIKPYEKEPAGGPRKRHFVSYTYTSSYLDGFAKQAQQSTVATQQRRRLLHMNTIMRESLKEQSLDDAMKQAEADITASRRMLSVTMLSSDSESEVFNNTGGDAQKDGSITSPPEAQEDSVVDVEDNNESRDVDQSGVSASSAEDVGEDGDGQNSDKGKDIHHEQEVESQTASDEPAGSSRHVTSAAALQKSHARHRARSGIHHSKSRLVRHADSDGTGSSPDLRWPAPIPSSSRGLPSPPKLQADKILVYCIGGSSNAKEGAPNQIDSGVKAAHAGLAPRTPRAEHDGAVAQGADASELSGPVLSAVPQAEDAGLSPIGRVLHGGPRPYSREHFSTDPGDARHYLDMYRQMSTAPVPMSSLGLGHDAFGQHHTSSYFNEPSSPPRRCTVSPARPQGGPGGRPGTNPAYTRRHVQSAAAYRRPQQHIYSSSATIRSVTGSQPKTMSTLWVSSRRAQPPIVGRRNPSLGPGQETGAVIRCSSSQSVAIHWDTYGNGEKAELTTLEEDGPPSPRSPSVQESKIDRYPFQTVSEHLSRSGFLEDGLAEGARLEQQPMHRFYNSKRFTSVPGIRPQQSRPATASSAAMRPTPPATLHSAAASQRQSSWGRRSLHGSPRSLNQPSTSGSAR